MTSANGDMRARRALPQGSLYIPMNRNFKKQATNYVTMTGVTMLKSLADGTNVHGAAHDITIQGNTLWFTSRAA